VLLGLSVLLVLLNAVVPALEMIPASVLELSSSSWLTLCARLASLGLSSLGASLPFFASCSLSTILLLIKLAPITSG